VTLAARQLTFDELRRARRRDPATSKVAARESHGLAAEHRLLILRALRDGGARDWTAHEIAAACALQSVQVSRRLAQMADEGDIRWTDAVRPTPSGRPARCLELVLT